MLASALFAATIGYFGSVSYTVAAAMLMIYGLIVWLDSSSLTAGAAGTADPARARRTARNSFGARIRGRVRGSPHDRIHTRPETAACRALPGGLAFLAIAILMSLAPGRVPGDAASRSGRRSGA